MPCHVYFKNSIRTRVKSSVMDLPLQKRKRSTYTNDFKVKVCEYAEKHGNRPAAQEYDMDESNIRRWRKKKAEMQKQPKRRQVGPVRGAQSPELEEEVVSWVLAGCVVSTLSIITKVCNLRGLFLHVICVSKC